MWSRQYLRGRVQGRRAATLGYYDHSLDDAARATRLEVAARDYDGDALDGFWRGAREIRPERLPRNVRARALAGDLPPEDRDARRQRSDTRWRRRNQSLHYWLIAGFAAVFGVLVAVTTAAQPWRPAHVIVYGYCALFVAVNSWWLPPRAVRAARGYVDEMATPDRANRRAAARTNLLWTSLVLVAFFGGLAGFLGLESLR